jgi:hypothetical protein
MLLHFLNNSLGVVALTSMDADAAPAADPANAGIRPITILLYGAAALLLAAVGWALYRSQARVVPGPDAGYPWNPPYPGVEYPPFHSGAVVVRPGPGWTATVLVLLAMAGFAAALIVNGPNV